MLKRSLMVGVAVLALAGCSSSSKTSTGGDTAAAGATAATGGTSGGTGKTTGSGTSTSNACAILTKDIASSILGGTVGAPTDEKAAGIPYPSCTYSRADGGFKTVGLTIFNGLAADTLIKTYQGQYPDEKALSGLGEQALQETNGQLVVAVNNHIGCVMLRAGDAPADPAASTKAMADVCRTVFAAG